MAGLDKEPDLVHMEARTADGRECLQPVLKKWALGVGMGIHSTYFVSPFIFQLIGKTLVMGFGVMGLV